MKQHYCIWVINRSIIVFSFIVFCQSAKAQYMPGQEPAAKTPTAPQPQFPSASQVKETKLTYKIIEALNGTYGYQVHADGRLLIHQNSIPALPGNNGFRTRAQSEKVAQLVIKKIRKGEMPPTITVEELKKLGVSP